MKRSERSAFKRRAAQRFEAIKFLKEHGQLKKGEALYVEVVIRGGDHDGTVESITVFTPFDSAAGGATRYVSCVGEVDEMAGYIHQAQYLIAARVAARVDPDVWVSRG